MPLISIIMPTYNGEKFLSQALSSVCTQGNHVDLECIVVDDGSTDGTQAIIEYFSKKLPVHVVEKTTARGWVASTNMALEKARGEFSCFLHQDDIWLPGRLNLLREYIEQFPDVDFFITAAQFIDDKGRQLGVWSPTWDGFSLKMSKNTLRNWLLIQNVLAIPAPLFRTSLAKKVGGLDESLWYTADWDFWLKLVSAGAIGYFPDKTVGFRVHQQAQTVTCSEDVEGFSRQMEMVLLRHAGDVSANDVYRRAASFSIRVNVVLASVLHGNWRAIYPILCSSFWFDWEMLRIYWQRSCIAQRVMARVRERVYAWRYSVRNWVRGDR